MAARNKSHEKSSQQKHLIGVYTDTKLLFSCSDKPSGELIDVSTLSIEIPIPLARIPHLEIRNEDTLDMAYRWKQDVPSSKILVLNMASKNAPGGGVRNGRTAQEECLFRRTNAFLTHDPSHYPLAETMIIFSPDITVIKDSKYKRIPEYHIGMISIPAVLSPPILDGKYKFAKHREVMRMKIESIFQLAIHHGFDSLVLGALGCGVYKNPLAEVFILFQRAVNKYGAHFDRIGFAVLDFGATGKENYDKFRTMTYAKH